VHRLTQTDRGRTGGLFCPGSNPNEPIRTDWLSKMGRPAGDALTHARLFDQQRGKPRPGCTLSAERQPIPNSHRVSHTSHPTLSASRMYILRAAPFPTSKPFSVSVSVDCRSACVRVRLETTDDILLHGYILTWTWLPLATISPTSRRTNNWLTRSNHKLLCCYVILPPFPKGGL
jgi:hypothetical protein